MSNLAEYLFQKRKASLARKRRIENRELEPTPIKAAVFAEGRSGIRRIRIRDFQIVTDSPSDFAGYDLGSGSPELPLGVLGSCLNHSFLIPAASLEVRLGRWMAACSRNRMKCPQRPRSLSRQRPHHNFA